MSAATQVSILSMPITGITGCCIPVVPGTPRVDGPMNERTELCAIDANWLVGAVPTCDIHLKLVCEQVDWDWPELVAEAGRDIDHAGRPWADRQRHSQEDARKHETHFMKGCAA